MKRILAALIIVLVFSAAALAQDDTAANRVLKKLDEVMNAFSDLSFTMTMVVTDKDGKSKERELLLWQKGEKRLTKFTAPASDRGIAFLSTDPINSFLYLPAYRKSGA